jgi:hypothetical protein
MTQTNEERVEENLDKPDSISIRIDEAYNKGVADTLARVREETIEECAVTIWQAWGSNDFPLEDSERSRTFSEAIKVVRALRALTPPIIRER